VNKTVLALILAAGVVGVLLQSAPSTAQKDPPKAQRARWEYRAVSEHDIDKIGGFELGKTPYESKFLEAGLNKLGEDGWELVQAGRGTGVMYLFKRPK
jgi:hypothetical protein